MTPPSFGLEETLFHPEAEAIVLTDVLHALSDPNRLAVVRRLMAEENREVPCREFEVTVAKSTLSHHIRVLREAGVVRVRREGTRSLTSLREKDLEQRYPGLVEYVLRYAADEAERA